MQGLQRSKTNYLQVLINLNFPDCNCVANVSGWKHGYVQNCIDWSGENWEETPALGREHLEKNLDELMGKQEEFERDFYSREVKYLFMIRNLYDSFNSRMKHIKDEYHFAYLVALTEEWNKKNRHYIHFVKTNPERSYVIRYEDFITREQKGYHMQRLVKHFKIPNAPFEIEDPGNRRIQPRAWRPKERGYMAVADKPFVHPETYASIKNRSEKEMEFIRGDLDPHLCKILNYEIF